ncbi:hypothetical protein [Caballeronia catudaia]|uniref:hypothetical protein n=1 Tax=Caballeronia catudaia TaxID=1777136 RepID=UPI000AD6C87D|nr:hypothetical protein [Caballeronia catudaia]
MNPDTLRTDTTFAGRIPELYDRLLVPMLFDAISPEETVECFGGANARSVRITRRALCARVR